MDPFLLSLAVAIASGISTVGSTLIQKGVVDPALEPAIEKLKHLAQGGVKGIEKNEALVAAILAAIEDASGQEGESQAVQYASKIRLHTLTLPANAATRDQVLRLVYLASSADPSIIPDALAETLRLDASLRASLAHFLFALRRRLNKLPEFKPLLEAAHQQAVETALKDMAGDLRAIHETIQPTPVGPAIQVLPVTLWKNHAYLDALVAEFSKLRLGIIDPHLAHSADKPITLDQIYTDLDAEELVPLAPNEKPARRPASSFDQAGRETRRMTALEAASQLTTPHLVLLGYPGSGKSTFVNFVSLCLAKEQRQPGSADGVARLTGWTLGNLFPVRIVLRELIAWADRAEQTTACAQVVWDYIAFATHALGYADDFKSLKQHLQNESGIVFFDGLDEVREADQRRDFIKRVIESFADLNSRCRIVVTCRPYAYQKNDWQLEGFRTQTLALFSPAQIAQFIEIWYRTLGPRENLTPTQVHEKTTSLQTAVQSPRLADLAQRPLLLTLMATLHVAGQLPEDRADLYDKTVKLMLDIWQSDKGENLKTFGLDAEQVGRIMGKLAFEAHRRQGEQSALRQVAVADLSAEDLRHAFKLLLHSGDRAEQVIEYIQKRAGLLAAQDPRTYTFPHRSFQEFMVACYFVESNLFPDDLIALVRHDRDWWREVYWLAAGRARSPRFSNAAQLVDALCPQDFAGQMLSELDAACALIAAQAAAEVRLPKRVAEFPRLKKLLERLQTWLVAIIAQGALPAEDRAEVGRILSALGDPREDVACALPALVDVPAGEFVMGSDTSGRGDEKPQHRVTLNAYRIGKYPVTNAQYRRFVEDDGYTATHRDCWTDAGWEYRTDRKITQPYYWDDAEWNVDNHPVVGVSWYEAVAYCNWLNKTNPGRRFRLPTEAEWERAARHTDRREYPWGNEFDPEKANTDERIGQTTAVGLYPLGKSECGAYDLAGNVWEWCSSQYEKYPYDPKDGREELKGTDTRVLRGGAWYGDKDWGRCAFRILSDPGTQNYSIGLRVAESPQ